MLLIWMWRNLILHLFKLIKKCSSASYLWFHSWYTLCSSICNLLSEFLGLQVLTKKAGLEKIQDYLKVRELHHLLYWIFPYLCRSRWALTLSNMVNQTPVKYWSLRLSVVIHLKCHVSMLNIVHILLQADFMNMPVPDNTYDAVYTIEASCHAPDPVSNLTFTKLCSSVVSSEWTGILAHLTITSLGFIYLSFLYSVWSWQPCVYVCKS